MSADEPSGWGVVRKTERARSSPRPRAGARMTLSDDAYVLRYHLLRTGRRWLVDDSPCRASRRGT